MIVIKLAIIRVVVTTATAVLSFINSYYVPRSCLSALYILSYLIKLYRYA